MVYKINAYHENSFISSIEYNSVRYYNKTIFHLLDCLELLDGGEMFINFRDIDMLIHSNLNEKERVFVESLDGYDVIELVFSSE